MTLEPDHRDRLLALARRSIERGLDTGRAAAAPELSSLPAPLAEPGASFVTLKTRGMLRGCRGALEASRALAHDVWLNAWASAFDDPRFPPLERSELGLIELEISILSALEAIEAGSEAGLLSQLEPHRHGLVLALGRHRATFLPQVWESLAEPDRFLGELKAKAGLPRDFWSAGMRAWRYTVESLHAGH